MKTTDTAWTSAGVVRTQVTNHCSYGDLLFDAYCLGDLGVGERIILKWILKENGVGVWTRCK
jgi:hypothetical protein